MIKVLYVNHWNECTFGRPSQCEDILGTLVYHIVIELMMPCAERFQRDFSNVFNSRMITLRNLSLRKKVCYYNSTICSP